MSKEIILIGNSGVGRTVATNSMLVAIDADDDILYINGKGYREKPRKHHDSTVSGRVSALAKLLIPFAMMHGGWSTSKKQPERPCVDIIKEFALIQRKSSDLSRSNRDWVERLFHSRFDEVFQEEPEREPDNITGED